MLLALPVIWSVCHPSVLGDIIHGLDLDPTWNYSFPSSFQGKPLFPSIFWASSMWNHPDKGHFLYGGQCHWHANGWSPTIVRHWNMPFQWVFQCVCHQKAIQWKHHIACTILVLDLWWLGGNFHLVCTGCTMVPWPTLGMVGVGQLSYIWYHGTRYPMPCRHDMAGTVPNANDHRHRPCTI